MKKIDIIISIAVLIGAVYMGLTVGSHGRAINRLMLETRRLYTVDSMLLDGIKSVDSLQWRSDSVLMEGLMLLNERINNISKQNNL